MTRKLVFVVPGDLESRTGGYGYDRRIAAGLRDRGWSVAVRTLDGSFPRPAPGALQDAARALGEIPDGETVLIDGLALGAMPDEVEREAARLRLVALIHHPLAEETGIDAARAAELKASETRSLAAVGTVVVTSHPTARTLSRYGVQSNRIVVVEPGTDRAPLASGSSLGSLRLLCVATLIPRKGHDVLFQALESIRTSNWRLTCAGSPLRDPATAARLRARVRSSALDDRVEFVGELGEAALAARYGSADLFVLPTLYEGYGMAVAEALACGLPVVSTATGAIPDLVGCEQGTFHAAGIVVPPGDVTQLAAAIARMLEDPEARERFRQGAIRARDRLSTWEDAADRMAAVLSS